MKETKKLKAMPYAQAHVTIDPETNEIRLISYTTTVIAIKDNELICTGTYSQTTRKHISAFMREYTDYSYYTAKFCYENNCTLLLDKGYLVNNETGEVFENPNWRN